MADLVALRNAFLRIGFPVEASQALVDQGIDNVSVLATLSEKDIDSMIKHMSHWRTAAPGGGAPVIPQMPYLAIVRLKVMREWVLE